MRNLSVRTTQKKGKVNGQEGSHLHKQLFEKAPALLYVQLQLHKYNFGYVRANKFRKGQNLMISVKIWVWEQRKVYQLQNHEYLWENGEFNDNSSHKYDTCKTLFFIISSFVYNVLDLVTSCSIPFSRHCLFFCLFEILSFSFYLSYLSSVFMQLRCILLCSNTYYCTLLIPTCLLLHLRKEFVSSFDSFVFFSSLRAGRIYFVWKMIFYLKIAISYFTLFWINSSQIIRFDYIISQIANFRVS